MFAFTAVLALLTGTSAVSDNVVYLRADSWNLPVKLLLASSLTYYTGIPTVANAAVNDCSRTANVVLGDTCDAICESFSDPELCSHWHRGWGWALVSMRSCITAPMRALPIRRVTQLCPMCRPSKQPNVRQARPPGHGTTQANAKVDRVLCLPCVVASFWTSFGTMASREQLRLRLGPSSTVLHLHSSRSAPKSPC